MSHTCADLKLSVHGGFLEQRAGDWKVLAAVAQQQQQKALNVTLFPPMLTPHWEKCKKDAIWTLPYLVPRPIKGSLYSMRIL